MRERDLRLRHWCERQGLVFWAVVGVVCFVVLAYAVLWLVPQRFAETDGLAAKDRLTAQQGVRTAALALLAGGIAVVGSIYTARTFALNRASQLTDRFTKAIEQLGHRTVDVRLGGIYALERIARDSRADHPQVVEVLTAFVREHAPRVPTAPEAPTASVHDEPVVSAEPARSAVNPRPDTDVQAALTVLGRRTLDHERASEPTLDLADTMLRGARLERAELQGADLHGADLSEAHVGGANLRGANLRGAILRGVDLSRFDLSGVDLHDANLQKADLRKANLSDADLRGADLHDAYLWAVDLRGARLEQSDLRGADLGGARLDGANLLAARYDNTTVWSAGFDHAAAVSPPTPGPLPLRWTRG